MKGGIENTLVYWLAVEIFNLTQIFCERYIDKKSRTAESNLKLTGISRASFGELIEDYKDFLWKNNLKLWEKNDPRVLRLRGILINTHETHVSHGASVCQPYDHSLHKGRISPR